MRIKGRGPLRPSEIAGLKAEKVRMLEILRARTADHSITWRELGEQLALTPHEVWGLISQLWRDKEPVCTDGIGFWYSVDTDDMRDTFTCLWGYQHMFLEGTMTFE